MRNQKAKLPESFRPLLWSYKFSEVDPNQHKRVIIVNTLNYGNLDQWRWLIKTYGREELKSTIKSISASEFRKPVIKLFFLLFSIKKLKYASRSDYIKARKGIR